jgi:amidase
VPALPVEGDLAVIGPMARSAGDLALALDILAGPDGLTNAIAYRVELPAPRHESLANFRILILDTHPLIPTAGSVRAALQRLAERLIKAGSKVGYGSPLVPDLAEAGRIFVKLMRSFVAAFSPIDEYQRLEAAAKLLSPEDNSLAAWRVRGAVLSHRDWVAADSARSVLRKQWRELFRQWDLVLCPPMPTPAFPHDHNPNYLQRQIDIDGVRCPYPDQIVWPSVATVAGLPATVAPIDRSEAGLPVGVQIIGPYLEDRSTIRFAELIEREFVGFVPPPNLAS